MNKKEKDNMKVFLKEEFLIYPAIFLYFIVVALLWVILFIPLLLFWLFTKRSWEDCVPNFMVLNSEGMGD